MRTVYIDDSTQGVKLGFRQEHDYTEIVYTLPSDWEGVVEAFIKKPGATASVPLTGVTQTDGTVSFTLTRADLIEAGRGALEYMCTMNGVVAKSKVFPVIIAADIISESTDRPDEWESWIDELTALAAQVRTDALSAAAAATSASGSAADASQSASGAAQSAQGASEMAESASESAQSASESAADAEEAKNTILNMTATATTLPEGSKATVDYSNGVMAFGIPKGDTGERGAKGDTGETGATPNLSIGTVETLAPDEDATATITGTAENPVLNLGLPKGDTGEVSLLELIANTKVDEKSDSVPYQMRTLSGVGSHESLRKIVGGTVAWNQLVSASAISVTVKNGHKYIAKIGGAWSVAASSGSAISVTGSSDIVFDLTQMFGSTIADYIYSLEQSQAGAGVAWFRNYFSKDYYPYDAGTLKSVQTSAHKTYDADGNVLGTYPLDSSLTLRGVPKLVDGKLAFDGDIYPPSGEVQRRYGVVDLGTLTWSVSRGGTNYERMFANVSDIKQSDPANIANILTTKYLTGAANYTYLHTRDKTISLHGAALYVYDSAFIGKTGTEFKTAMSGVYLVYEKATPTTETASPYTEIQSVESGGSEEFVGATIPVGHESTYPRTLADTMPTQDGSYSLSLTVSGGKPSVEWEVSQ